MLPEAVGSAHPNVVHLNDVAPRSRIFTRWDRARHHEIHWFTECVAEFLGVFLYCYAGLGSTAAWVIGNVLEEVGVSSVFQIGISYAAGIVFAITICGATSGGIFHPGIAVALTLFKGFPPGKALRYITAQILGGYVACLLVYVQYKHLLDQVDLAMAAAGVLEKLQFTPSGTAGIFGLYVAPGSHLGQVFLNEFVTDVMLTLVIWGSIDPTNIRIPPFVAPFTIAMAYATAVWSYSVPGIATNAARDVGGRLAALTIYGREAHGGPYAAIAALTNVPATLFGVFLYEFFLADAQRVIPALNREYLSSHRDHGCLHEESQYTPSVERKQSIEMKESA
ncbi:putative aquaporin 2 [Cylindrobasidium torrendii FP15055 ss-10]|uniref:Putative aquaporin 2 n=1 Tax=Cylindrobasidium torrendii FP15055 ss-10 TaxID=1314674 RepID=A0A0D7BFL8_9AGAR|nr:putative aquaporin 2 [Cylindrobasidium torrendii FP15055 ss-10]